MVLEQAVKDAVCCSLAESCLLADRGQGRAALAAAAQFCGHPRVRVPDRGENATLLAGIGPEKRGRLAQTKELGGQNVTIQGLCCLWQ